MNVYEFGSLPHLDALFASMRFAPPPKLVDSISGIGDYISMHELLDRYISARLPLPLH